MFALIALTAMQSGGPPPVVSLSKLPASIAAGHTFKATLTVKFADGLHGYQNPPSTEYDIPVSVKLSSGPAKLVKVIYPKGVNMTVTGETKPVSVYTGTVTIGLVLKSGTASGPIVFDVNYQECNDTSCFPPDTIKVKSQLTVHSKG
jgi:hypothetical protein